AAAMVRINTSVNGSSLIQKLTCAFGCGCATWGTLDGAGCGSRSALLIVRPPPATARIGSQDFDQNSLNRPVVCDNWATNRRAFRLFAHRGRAQPSYMNVIGFGPRM